MKNILKLFAAVACLCMLFACSKSDEQVAPSNSQSSLKKVNTQNGTGVDIYDYTMEHPLNLPVMCDGKEIDVLTMTGLTVVIRDHYIHGEWKFYGGGMNNFTMTSKNNPTEVFSVKVTNERFYSNLISYMFFNAIGDQGSHYTVHTVTDLTDWNNPVILESVASCH